MTKRMETKIKTKPLGDIHFCQLSNANGTVGSYLKGQHGNIVGSVDINGAMVESVTNRMDYDAFGNQWIGETPDPFGYCGEYYDEETGLVYLRNRYYDTETGRFISEDPAKDGLNWYVYCNNNPVNFVDPTGYAWTKEDQKVYEELGGFWSPKAREFKREIDIATAEWEKAEGDIYAENNARYRAVVARQEAYYSGYVDNFDYTRGKGTLIYLGAHTVVSPANHASIIIMVNSSSAYYGTNSFAANEPLWNGTVQYATLGAGNVNGNLVSDVNRAKDIKLDIKNEMINTGASGDEMIRKLFSYEKYYRNNNTLEYTLFPGKNSIREHNSNSFTNGILKAAGIYVEKPPRNLPGWDQPLESWRFRP